MKTAQFKIAGMHCQACVRRVTAAIEKVGGVKTSKVDIGSADVEFDPVNHLFLVAQPNSSTASSGSSIHVYDVSGNLIESINGLNFSNAFNVIPAHIALNPGKRTGFVDGPDVAAGQIQSFTY